MTRLLSALSLVVASMAMLGGPAAAQETGPDVVAQVGVVGITKVDFDRWFAQAAHSRLAGTKLTPPRFERCVAAKRLRRAGKGWRKLSARALRDRCRRLHGWLLRQTMRFLIQAQWIEQEAALQGVEVSAERVDRLFNSQRRQAFSDERDYRRFLRRSGATEAGIKYRIRLDELQARLTELVVSQAMPVIERDIARYRANHRKQLADLPVAQVRRLVRRLLTSRRETSALERFVQSFRRSYRSMSRCARGYAIPECGAAREPQP